MELVLDIIKIMLMLTGAATWLLAVFVVAFYWMCQIPPKD